MSVVYVCTYFTTKGSRLLRTGPTSWTVVDIEIEFSAAHHGTGIPTSQPPCTRHDPPCRPPFCFHIFWFCPSRHLETDHDGSTWINLFQTWSMSMSRTSCSVAALQRFISVSKRQFSVAHPPSQGQTRAASASQSGHITYKNLQSIQKLHCSEMF